MFKRRSSRTEVFEITAVVVEILFVVREVRLALLEERLRLPERQSEDASHLLAAAGTVTIGLKATASSVPRDTSRHADSIRFAMWDIARPERRY
jgi:hypothetical protein